MAKVLLVIDDYQEMVNLEALLRKLGFDATGVSNELSLSEQLLSFNPDLVMAYGKNKKVSTVSVGQKLAKAKSFSGKVLLVFPKGGRPRPQDLVSLRMDAMLDAPLDEQRLVTMLAGLCQIPLEQLTTKLGRNFQQGNGDRVNVRGGGGPDLASFSGRTYDQLFKNEKLPPDSFGDRIEIRRKWQEAKPSENPAESEDRLAKKQAFARALLQKKK